MSAETNPFAAEGGGGGGPDESASASQPPSENQPKQQAGQAEHSSDQDDLSTSAETTALACATLADAHAAEESDRTKQLEGQLEERASHLDQRERQLDDRRRELDEHELELSKRERNLGTSGRTRKNWPSSKLRLARHTIRRDIPAPQQRAVYISYALWLLFAVTLLYNLICTLANDSARQNPITIVFALIFLFLGVPLAWMLWHKRLYNALKNGSSFSFVFYFIFFGVHIAFCALAAIAPPFGSNSQSMFNGWINAIDKAINGGANESVEVGKMMLVCAAIWTINAGVSIPVLGLAIRTYRMKGHSISRARKEIADGSQPASTNAALVTGSQRDASDRV